MARSSVFSITNLADHPAVHCIEQAFAAFRIAPENNLSYLYSGINLFEVTVIGICLQGQMRLTVNEKEHLVKAEDFYGILIDHRAEVKDVSGDFLAINVAVSSKFIDETLPQQRLLSNILMRLVDSPITHLRPEECQRITAWFKLVYEYSGLKYHPLRYEIVRSLLASVFYDVCGILENQHHGKISSRAEDLFVQFLRLVSHHSKTERTVSFYAEKLGVTPKHLTATITRISGKSTLYWITRYVIIEAKSLLKNTNMSIGEIAEELNFASQSFFGKFFKSSTDISPSQYRQQSTEEEISTS